MPASPNLASWHPAHMPQSSVEISPPKTKAKASASDAVSATSNSGASWNPAHMVNSSVDVISTEDVQLGTATQPSSTPEEENRIDTAVNGAPNPLLALEEDENRGWINGVAVDEGVAVRFAVKTGDRQDRLPSENQMEAVEPPNSIANTGLIDTNGTETFDPAVAAEPFASIQNADSSELTGPTETNDESSFRSRGEGVAREPQYQNETKPQSTTTSPPTNRRPESFARTVAHEFNWNDDEGPEWTLPRSPDADPTSFLSSSDRSDSFPPVPPRQYSNLEPAQPETKWDISGADTIDNLFNSGMNDGEEDDDLGFTLRESIPITPADLEPMTREYDGDGDGEKEEISDVVGEATDTRYEEGLPLISPHDQDSGQMQEEDGEGRDENANGVAKRVGFFDDVDASEGWFAQNEGDDQDTAGLPKPLERKSTLQVIGNKENSEESDESDGEERSADSPQEKQLADSDSKQVPLSGEPIIEDLDAKWKEVFDDVDDDDFLNDSLLDTQGSQEPHAEQPKKTDIADIFGSDDEGFLDDQLLPEPMTVPKIQHQAQSQVQHHGQMLQVADNASRYTPSFTPEAQQATPYTAAQNAAPAQLGSPYKGSPYKPANMSGASRAVSPYMAPSAPAVQPATHSQQQQQQTNKFAHSQSHYGQQPARPEAPRAESFADKAKSGYASPYDLPLDLVKTRRPQPSTRTSQGFAIPAMQQSLPPHPIQHPLLPTPPPSHPPPPPHPAHLPVPNQHPNTGLTAGPPLVATMRSSSLQPHGTSPTQQPGLTQKLSMPALRGKESFFEELPLASRPRPGSRHSQGSALSSPSLHSSVPFAPPTGPPQGMATPHMQPGPTPVQGLLPHLPHGLTPPPSYPPTAISAAQTPSPLDRHDAPGSITGLVAPEKVNPYAPMASQVPASVPTMPHANSRYSPAPPPQPSSGTGGIPPATSRYSPATVPSKPATYSSSPSVHSHLPRTSSPLAYMEVSQDKSHHGMSADHVMPDRRPIPAHEPRLLNRIPSLPSTREVEEEDDGKNPPSESHDPRTAMPMRQTPPPIGASHTHVAMSPSRRSSHNYIAQPASSSISREFTSPTRSRGISPSGTYQSRSVQENAILRPASLQGSPGPKAQTTAAYVPAARPRAPSLNFNLVPPTDGRQHDPLQRWKGTPIFAWGVGGTVVTSFPKEVPRYGGAGSGAAATLLRVPGDVMVRNFRDLVPLDEQLDKFPGPLRGKSKKKDTLAWLTAGIEALEKTLGDPLYQPRSSHEHKRAVERMLLWKVLHVFIENDGSLEGTPAIESAVRGIFAPELETEGGDSSETTDELSPRTVAPGIQEKIPLTAINPDAIDPSVVDTIRRSLMLGESEKAVWTAVDRRLWGHAMLIANTASPELYAKVAQEFVRNEVNIPGRGNESMAALYNVLSGNFDECVDELVPAHARAGFKLIASGGTGGLAGTGVTGTGVTGTGIAGSGSEVGSGGASSQDATVGLEKWRETLCLVLSNRRPDDVNALRALGKLLSGYGRAEAAHICFMFARGAAVFGGLDDPASDFVLVGADHRLQHEHFAKDVQALILSEVYEYGLTLATSPPPGVASSAVASLTIGAPHLAGYKLHVAMALAEAGRRSTALRYCEAIAAAVTGQTKRSGYHHALLEAAVDELAQRLRQAPGEGSGSWISKPNMGKVSDSVWNRFNKFVAGDDAENEGAASSGGGMEGSAEGLFERLAGTPGISRSGSMTNLEMLARGTATGGMSGQDVLSMQGMYPTGMMLAPMAPPSTVSQPQMRAASKYAPASAVNHTQTQSPLEPVASSASSAPSVTPYSPGTQSSTERSSGEYVRSAYEPRPGSRYAPSRPPSQGLGAGNGNPSSYTPLGTLQQPSGSSGNYQPPPPDHTYSPSLLQSSHTIPSASSSVASPLGWGNVVAPASTSVAGSYSPIPLPPAALHFDDTGKHGEAEQAETGRKLERATSSAPSVSLGYEPPNTTTSNVTSPTPDSLSLSQPTEEAGMGGTYEPPSYGYEPPSYEYEPTEEQENNEAKPRPKKSFMDDDNDNDIPAIGAKVTTEKTKEGKARKTDELFKKAAEEDEKRHAAQQAQQAQQKRGWGFTSWFGRKDAVATVDTAAAGEASPSKAIKAKLGEENSFIYDPDLKRWVNKKAGAETQEAPKAAPPPPRAAPQRTVSSSLPSTPPPLGRMASAPPPALGPSQSMGALIMDAAGAGNSGGEEGNASGGVAPGLAGPHAELLPPGLGLSVGGNAGGRNAGALPMLRSASAFSATGGPPSRPGTSMSNASSIDDLLGAPGTGAPRRAKKTKKGGRYVDVMAK